MKITLNILLLFILFQSSAQNLVPNGGFEYGPDSSSYAWEVYYDSMCSVADSVPGPDDWVTIQGAPDRILENDNYYFTFCNAYDIDTAQSGEAYIVLTYDDIIKCALLSPLEQDSLYRLRCYLDYEEFQFFPTSPNKVKFGFTTNDTISTNYISSTSWGYYDTTFTATGNHTELYLTCTVDEFGGVKIDGLSIEKQSTLGVTELSKTNKTLIRVFDTMGRETEVKPNTLMIHLYSDGTTEKVFRVE